MTFGEELVVLHTTPSMFGKFFDECLEVVWTFRRRTFYLALSKGEAHFGMQRRAQMSLALNEPNTIAPHSNSKTISTHAPQVEKNY